MEDFIIPLMASHSFTFLLGAVLGFWLGSGPDGGLHA